MVSWMQCVFGPRLYRIYKTPNSTTGYVYQANGLERNADLLIRWIKLFYSLSYYSSPILILVLYRRGYFGRDGASLLLHAAGYITILLVGAVSLRGLGRLRNKQYTVFCEHLNAAKTNFNPETKKVLSGYDFDFKQWPVEFRQNDVEGDESKPRILLKQKNATAQSSGFYDAVTSIPVRFLGYVSMHTFGRRLVYPGAVHLLQAAIGGALEQGRAKLVEQYNGIRTKLQCTRGNEIDTMFVDRRNDDEYANGKFLVITCEGNAGFYEIGCMATPLEAGYSVLGWNHPGFWGSTGTPLPDQEASAIDIVMQYAIHRLGFKLENIIIFSWSIGGYSAVLAAVNYPDIKGLVLDATFDDLVPLSVARMPGSIGPVVKRAVKDHMDLNIAELLDSYQGPISIVRRLKDEMVTTAEPNQPDSLRCNRGNDLIVHFLRHRYPNIVTDASIPVLWEWLEASDQAEQILVWSNYAVDSSICTTMLTSYVEENGNGYPLLIGEDFSDHQRKIFALFLVSKYLTDFDSTHCTPLPAALFKTPWSELNNSTFEIID